MKKILLNLILGLLIITTASASELQTFDFQNETIGITLRVNESCGIEENLFRVERLNYTTGGESLKIIYEQQTKIENETLSTTIIEKEINKYTATRTGYVNSSTNKLYVLVINLENQTKQWNFQGNCSVEENLVENVTENETEEQNSTDNITNNSSIINSTDNSTINITINNTNFNETVLINNNTELNNTVEDNTTENHSEEIEEERVCFEFVETYTNKEIYEVGEKAEIQFYLRPISNSFSITYWIEDLKGNIIKNSYTTDNLNEKSYTFKEIDQEEKAYLIKASFSDECGEQEKSKLVVVKSEQFEETETNSQPESNISIEEIEINENEAIITLNLQKGETAKTTITCEFVNKQGRKIVEDIKIKLLTKNQEATIRLPLANGGHEETIFRCEGLDTIAEKEILFPKKENEKESQDKMEEEVEKEENKNTAKKIKEEVKVESLLAEKTISFEAEEEKITGFSVKSTTINKQNKAQKLIAGILSATIIGGIVTYKRSIPRKRGLE